MAERLFRVKMTVKITVKIHDPNSLVSEDAVKQDIMAAFQNQPLGIRSIRVKELMNGENDNGD